MKKFTGILRSFFKWFLIVLAALNVLILASGKSYLYKGIANTYFRGRTSVSIDDYPIFENRIVKSGEAREWAPGKDYNKSEIPSRFVPDMERMGTIA